MRTGLFGLVVGKRKPGGISQPRILLYESEARRIAFYTRSSPRLEIGGDLFGFYEPGGSPLVFVASGPGPAAQRDATHFQQDPEFQSSVFKQLATKFRMFYVGDWHSHHELGLSKPSGPDDAKLQDLAEKNGWPQLFSLIVETESSRGSQTEPREGPIKNLGVCWNAFNYSFDAQQPARQRVVIEFESGANPYETESDKIDASIRRDSPVRVSSARSMASAVLPSLQELELRDSAIVTNEIVLTVYQNICRLLSDTLEKAHMEVDLDSLGGPHLVVSHGQETITCRIISHSDVSRVVIEPAGGDQTEFEVPCKHGQIAPADINQIADGIVRQFKSVETGKRKGSKRT